VALTEEGWIAATGQIGSSYIKAHRSAGGAKKGGARANAIGILRRGRTTKIHALVDVLGRPLRLVLTPGNTSDVKGADLLIGETIGMKRVIAGRGYHANCIRAVLREQGTIPVISGHRNRKRPIKYDERHSKDRWRIEAMFCRLNDFRRIATRYDKIVRNFLSAVSSLPPWHSGSERVWTLVHHRIVSRHGPCIRHPRPTCSTALLCSRSIKPVDVQANEFLSRRRGFHECAAPRGAGVIRKL
jgi:transposase